MFRRLRGQLRSLLQPARHLGMLVVVYLPGPTGIALRRRYYSKRFKSCGKGLRIQPGVHIASPRLVEAGDNGMIRENANIQTGTFSEDDAREISWVKEGETRAARGVVPAGRRPGKERVADRT